MANRMLEHWDHFCKQYLEVTLRVSAYAAAMYFLAPLGECFVQALPGDRLRALMILIFCVVEFELLERLVERIYRPLFAARLEREDFEYRAKSEKLVISLLLFFLINFAVSVLVPSDPAVHINWKTSYPVMGSVGIAAGINVFLGVAIWSALKRRRRRGSRVAVFLTGLLFQAPAFAYALLTLLYFFLWNEQLPFRR